MRLFWFLEVDRMWCGGKGAERSECILNSTPLEFFLFCISFFAKSEERRGMVLNSLEYFFVFRSSFFENSEEKGEGNLF